MAKNDRTTAGPYWTRNWIEKMWRFTAENFVDFDTGAVDFEALGREEYEFRKALFYRKFKNSERAREAFVESEDLYKVNVERGKKGGRPRKDSSGTEEASESQRRTGTEVPEVRRAAHSPAPVRTRAPRNFDEVRDFAEAQGLDYDDMRLWWQRNYVERDGIDKDGKPIKNWKGALVNACKAEETKRRTA